MSPEAVEKRSITNERDYNEQSRRTQAFIFSSVPFNQMVVCTSTVPNDFTFLFRNDKDFNKSGLAKVNQSPNKIVEP